MRYVDWVKNTREGGPAGTWHLRYDGLMCQSPVPLPDQHLQIMAMDDTPNICKSCRQIYHAIIRRNARG